VKKKALQLVMVTVLTLGSAGIAYAAKGPADPMDGLWPIIALVQAWIKPISICLAMWGLVEYGLENPAGKTRIRVAFIVFIGSFLIPYVFDAIGRSFSGQ
jgi:hypothetical protein